MVEGGLQLHFESLLEGSPVPEMLLVPGCGKDDGDLFPSDRTLVSPVYRITGFMKIVPSFPREVSVLENVLIPMGDAVRLAARIWLPADARASPVPAILEYLPYRQADRMRDRDEPMHGYLAGHGYASVRVDLRGTGDSEGVLLDEYHRQEIEDALEVIGWIRAQPWCSGTVGMMGISWGGFNALPTTATPTMLTIWAAAFSTRTWSGAQRSSRSKRFRPTLAFGESVGGHCGMRGSRARLSFPSAGCGTNIGTTTGSTARCARTMMTSPAPSTPWAGGPMPIPTPSPGFSSGFAFRGKGSSVPGPMPIRTSRLPGPRSDSFRSS
jgi:hypothetical protein